jgi:TonB family protein
MKSRFLDTPTAGYFLDKQAFDPDGFILDADKGQEVFAQSFGAQKDSSGGREIIFQPAFSVYPEWEQHELKADNVVFKIFISAEGLVEEVTNLKTSGNPEIDAALARYIRRWRFAPASDLSGQWQRVKMKLTLRGSHPLAIELEG